MDPFGYEILTTIRKYHLPDAINTDRLYILYKEYVFIPGYDLVVYTSEYFIVIDNRSVSSCARNNLMAISVSTNWLIPTLCELCYHFDDAQLIIGDLSIEEVFKLLEK